MLKAALFVADAALVGMLRGMASESNEFDIIAVAERAPTGYDLARTLNTITPDIILIELTNPDRDLGHAAAVHEFAPDIPIVGLASRDLQPILDANPDYGVASLAVWPFNVVMLEQAIERAVHRVAGRIHQNLVAFLPGKAGSGSTTVVLHTAAMAAQQLQQKVLVIEGDLHSGLLGMLLNLKPAHNVRDALAAAPGMDARNWEKYVISAHGVDFLITDPAVKEPIPSWTHYYQLLRFATPQYALIMVDLPEIVNSATAEAVRTARAVYVLTTPELPSLRLAHQRCQELENWGVDGSRIQVVLNRWHKHDMSRENAEEVLGHPVVATFRNDYQTVQQAIVKAVPVGPGSDLGEAYLKFARTLTGTQPKKGFMNLFRR